MKRALRRNVKIYHYANGERVLGPPPNVKGYLTDVRGDLTNVWGNLTYISGYLTGVKGNLTYVSGNLDKCGLTEEDREKGVNIEDLIEE